MSDFPKAKQIVTLATGISSLCLCWLSFIFVAPGIIPLACGIVSLLFGIQANKSGCESKLPKIGMILGIIGLVLTVLFALIEIIIFAGLGSAASNYSY